MSTRSFAIALIFSLAALAAHDKSWTVPKEAAERKNPVKPKPAGLKASKVIFEDNCAMCHGSKGNGKGEGADMLQVKPADFTDAKMMSEETDGGIFYKLSEGRMPMAAYKGKFSEEERWGLVNYIRTFAKKAPKKASAKK